jgi:hypothetical protein
MSDGPDIYGGAMLVRFWENHMGKHPSSNAGAWRNKALDLERQLAIAQESEIFSQIDFDANNLVLRLALEALKKSDPNSPLLDKQNRDLIRRQHINNELSARGYKYDMASGKVERKIR